MRRKSKIYHPNQFYLGKSLYLHLKQIHLQMAKEINRIKAVLSETGKTTLWLAEQLGVNPTTVSK